MPGEAAFSSRLRTFYQRDLVTRRHFTCSEHSRALYVAWEAEVERRPPCSLPFPVSRHHHCDASRRRIEMKSRRHNVTVDGGATSCTESNRIRVKLSERLKIGNTFAVCLSGKNVDSGRALLECITSVGLRIEAL